MRVDDKSRRNAKRVSKDTVCGFSPDSWKFYQFLHRIWNFTVVFFDEYFSGLRKILGFGAIESARLNEIFYFFERRLREFLWRGKFGKEGRRC